MAGVELRGRVLNASGTFDAVAALRTFGTPMRDHFPFAAFVSKTITPSPRGGNLPPRLWEAPAGLINSIGLPNKGLEGFVDHDLPQLATLGVPLIVSVAGFSYEEFTRLTETIGARPEVAAIELNISCPNVKSGCVMGAEPGETEALMACVRPMTTKPLIVKLTPNVTDVAAIAGAAERGGADAISLINTLRAASIDPATGQPALGAGSGGLSGPAVRPVAVEMTRAVASAVRVPVIGMGGIQSGADAFEFVCAGAALVAVGTESFRDPLAGSRIAAELDELLFSSGRVDRVPAAAGQVQPGST